MKKKIEADLVQIAEKILNEKGKLDAGQLKEMAKDLYEKLTVLAFTEKYLAEETKEAEPKPEQKAEPVPQPKVTKQNNLYDEFYPDGTEYNEDYDAITEPNTEKIKDIVAQMPPETAKVDHMMNNINEAPQKPQASKPKPAEPEPDKRDFRNIGVDYDNLPDFEPVNHVEKNNKPRSLNDRLKKGINIGLNERLAYIKHLFDGNTADYNRVLSQLNTFTSLEESIKFIDKVVKPDYNNWEGKEVYEERFMAHIENKFSK
ncbi:hypothetical protein [Christiangramia sediminis]|uniref:Uncharacterized protein n=1 Tax=Christiangramia sediminis TaxID=2881336 RepID=A0A9X1LKA1_9FLAO|nr:hypothetical protein [Christiangramia sediminis]MCB7481949.1 hypothetical protein [Christiangramia sediminis]